MALEMILNSHYFHVLIRLLAAMLLGGIVGFERAGGHQAAGLRTHILVCVGSASVILAGIYADNLSGIDVDITRMGAQVISGIGFLGAGAIITTSGDKIRGLTTAAGLWVTACMGILAGLGAYWAAFVTIAIVMVAIFVLKPVAKRLEMKRRVVALQLDMNEDVEINKIYEVMKLAGLKPTTILDISSNLHSGIIHVSMQSIATLSFDYSLLLKKLREIPSITSIHCDFRGTISPSCK